MHCISMEISTKNSTKNALYLQKKNYFNDIFL